MNLHESWKEYAKCKGLRRLRRGRAVSILLDLKRQIGIHEEIDLYSGHWNYPASSGRIPARVGRIGTIINKRMLQLLSNEELKALIAHELGHILFRHVDEAWGNNWYNEKEANAFELFIAGPKIFKQELQKSRNHFCENEEFKLKATEWDFKEAWETLRRIRPIIKKIIAQNKSKQEDGK